jgi:AraC family transcriptional activator of pobA
VTGNSAMDRPVKILDYLNIPFLREQRMDIVPTYTLYGENDKNIVEEWLHCETIAARSARFEWRIDAHRHHNLFQILHIRRGDVEAALDDQTVAANTPVLITVPPRTVHGFRFTEETLGHVITLPFGRIERLLNSCPDAREILLRPQVVKLARRDVQMSVARQIAAVAQEFAGSDPWRSPLIEAHLTTTLILVARLVSAMGARNPGILPLNRRAIAFRALVDRTYRRGLSVADCAAKLGTSHTHLNRICRAAFNESALAVINRRVILEATRELTFTRLSIKEIAVSLGFEDPAYFTRFFKKHVGRSPNHFRRNQTLDLKRISETAAPVSSKAAMPRA